MSRLAERRCAVRDRTAPEARGIEWLGGDLPVVVEAWPAPEGRRMRVVGTRKTRTYASTEQVNRYLKGRLWVAPEREVCFLTDLHADVDAFWRSLVAGGGVAKTGPGKADFELTESGARTRFVLGGDLFHKGPANLPLLDGLRDFLASGADVTLLAGNHDVRTLLGILHAGSRDPGRAHLFSRIGRKAMGLFKEIFDAHVAGGDGAGIGAAEFHERYLPDESWYAGFPGIAEGILPESGIAKEMRRVRARSASIEAQSADLGLSLGDLHRAIEKSRQVFVDSGGEHRWLLDRLQLCDREGACLFVHAGVDDTIATSIRRDGVRSVNQLFRAALFEAPHALYEGPIGNAFRTKYRDLDHPLTEAGLGDLHGAGIYAIVHGHRNGHVGQRLTLKKGMLNFECDASVDRNTRSVVGIPGPGAAATVLKADGRVLGISTDHPAVKVFDPGLHGSLVIST